MGHKDQNDIKNYIMKALLSKENSLILRGLAIMFIMLHNFLHNPSLGFSQENEMSFSSEKAHHFFNVLADGGVNAYELFSFLGWVGVPVFVFLTGYGISKVAPPSNLQSRAAYVKSKYLKLLLLLLPAILIYMLKDILHAEFLSNIYKRIVYLTMMANVAYPWVNCPPGVYWYFGLTFQFYLIYCFCGDFLKGKVLFIGSLLSIMGVAVLSLWGSPNALSVYMHCFTGWFPIFAIGIWVGGIKNDQHSLLVSHNLVLELAVFLFSASLVLLMNRWMSSWLFVSIIALIMFVSAGLLVLRSGVLANAFKWIGGLSACIFVCHPIARFLINGFVRKQVDSLILVVLAYVALTFVLAIAYNKLYKRLLLWVKAK